CRGGWTTEAATAVALGVDEIRSDRPLAGTLWVSSTHPLAALEHLRDCSFVIAEETADGTMRFRMLETVREYAADQLAQEETGPLVRAHAEYFLGLAEEADVELRGPHQIRWFQRLELEHDNLRTALAHAPSEIG